MNFGIPFKRPWGIPFGVPFLGSGTGGPLFPSSGNVGYYNPWDISKLGFSSANNTNLVSDQKSINDLTQGTASANPLFIENDTVTQYTASNQPKLVDTGGGVLAVEFEDGQCLSEIPVTTDFSILIKGVYWYNVGGGLLSSSLNVNSRLTRSGVDFILVSDSGNAFNLGSYTFVDGADLKLVKNNNNIELFENGVKQNTIDVTGESFTLDRISRDNLNFQGHITLFKKWNSADSSGTPDFELLPTVASCNTAIGGNVERWNATSHRGFKNRFVFDSDDNLNGLAPQSGDFSYMIKLSFNILSSTEYILTDSAGDSALLLLSDNYLYLRDTGGANDIALDNHSVVAGEHVYVITREGNTIKYYVDSILKQTVDVTGRAYTFNRFGSDADSMQGSIDDWGVWNRALTQEEVDYFSYLRNKDTNAILLPPTTPSEPIIHPVNSANLNSSTQYITSTNASLYNFGTESVFISGWVKSGVEANLYFKGEEAGTDSQNLFISFSALADRNIVLDLAISVSSRRQWVTSTTPIPNDGDWHHIALYHARTSDSTDPNLWVDGVDLGTYSHSYTTGSGWSTVNFNQTKPVRMGSVRIGIIYYSEDTGVFVNTIKGYSPTQADIDELYNNGTPKCYDEINATLQSRFMSFIDAGTFNGRTEVQALTEHVESHEFTNVNSAPFTGTGLSVEC